MIYFNSKGQGLRHGYFEGLASCHAVLSAGVRLWSLATLLLLW